MPVAACQEGSRVAGRSDVQASTNSRLQVLKVDEIIRTASQLIGDAGLTTVRLIAASRTNGD